MPGPDKIKLLFVRDPLGLPFLVKTELMTGQGLKSVAEAKPKGEPNGFVWDIKKGKIRMLALALVRAARLAPQEGEEIQPPLMLLEAIQASSETRKCTETQLYDLLASKDCDWLTAILSPAGDWGEAKRRFNNWFQFHNIRGKDSTGLPSVELRIENLPPGNVEVLLDGQGVGASSLDWIESILAANIDQTFPPMFGSGRIAAGFMPTVGPSFGNRDKELAGLTARYDDKRCSYVELIAEGGAGKTSLARWWIRQLYHRNHLQERLVFSWSFPRQNRADGTRQSLSSFFRALGTALNVPVSDGMTPQDLADRLLAGIQNCATFLFLDGIEALMDRLGEFSIGGERREIRNAEGESKIHYDSFLNLLRGIMAFDTRQAFILVTSREPVIPALEVGAPIAGEMKIGAFPGVSYYDPELEREGHSWKPDSNALAQELSEALKFSGKADDEESEKDEIEFDYPMAKHRLVNVSPKIRHLVRKAAEQFGVSPERCLLYIASSFDRAADWDAVMHVIRSEKGALELTSPWRALDDEQWNIAYENLLSAGLVLPSGGGYIALHPSVHQSVYEDFRNGMPEACAEVHRRLCEYYCAIPKQERPDTMDELQPLFRACWHGCNSGDFKTTFDYIAYHRICRKWEAYIVFQLCEYEETLQVLNLFTEDGETFPASDLDESRRVMIIHGCALALRYVDRLNEAYRVEKLAWKKSMAMKSKPGILPIAGNLLRLHHMFGDLGDNSVSQVLWSILKGALAGIGTAAEEEDIPKSFVPEAIGYVAGIAALVQACRGSTQAARNILRLAWLSCRAHGMKNKFLMPGMGGPHHSLALLELGEHEIVLKGIKAQEMSRPMARYSQTGMLSYIEGRALAASNDDPVVQRGALALLEDTYRKARRNFKWWKAASAVEIGSIRLTLREYETAREAFVETLKIAGSDNNCFKLLEVDALLGLARCEIAKGGGVDAKAYAQKALTCIQKCGFKLRQKQAERLLKEA